MTSTTTRRTRPARKITVLASAVGLSVLAFFAGDWAASASGTQLQNVSKTETIVNSHCYTSRSVTTTYYYWSSTHGWTRYAAPKVTVTTSETCH